MRKGFLILFIYLIYCNLYSQSTVLEIRSYRNLTFGMVIPGINTRISETNSNAGRFYIYAKKVNFSINFNLPSNLTSGGDNLPIKFTATKSENSNDAVAGTSFDPYTGTYFNARGSTRELYIRLGGTTAPSTTQAAGSYSGTIIMTLTITDN